MAKLDKELIRQSLPVYCDQKGIAPSAFAEIIDVSPATISNIKNGKWDNISEKIWRKIWNKVNPEILSGYLQTSDGITVFKTCDRARAECYMIGLIGQTGYGKTTSLQAYALKKNVFYIEFEYGLSPRAFLKMLLKVMGKSVEGGTNELLNRASDELNLLNAPLVIVDDAGKMGDSMIMLLHSLRNKTIRNCGIILSGVPYFRTNLKKLVEKDKIGYAEFVRRVNIWETLLGLSVKEAEMVLDLHGVTDPTEVRRMKNITKFGDLINSITVYKESNLAE